MNIGPIYDIVQPFLPGRVKRSGRDNIITLCPFHDDRSPSFWLNVNNGLWICFSCGLRGNLKMFLKLAGLSHSQVAAAVEPVAAQIALFRQRESIKRKAKFYVDPYRGSTILPESLLGVYEYKPHMMIDAGFDPELLRAFDIGYDRRLERVTFPLRDLYGNLVGISGRATEKSVGPRYKVYRGGYRNEKGEFITGDFGENFDELYRNYELDSHKFLWNSHNAYPVILHDKEGTIPVVITEGYKACLKLVQYKWVATMALAGASISEDQMNVLIRLAGNPIILFLDNDEEGIEATRREGRKINRNVNKLSVAEYPKGYSGASPDDLSLEQAAKAIANAKEWNKWVITKF